MNKEKANEILAKLKFYKNNNDSDNLSKYLLQHKKPLEEYLKTDPILNKQYKLLCINIEKKFFPKREYI